MTVTAPGVKRAESSAKKLRKGKREIHAKKETQNYNHCHVSMHISYKMLRHELVYKLTLYTLLILYMCGLRRIRKA